MKRREFFGLVAAAVPALAAVPSRKAGKVEIVFKSPGPRPNGLQATDQGLWILDAGDNRAYLVRYDDGKVLRALDTESTVGSGITFGSDSLWIASTPKRVILRVDPMTGKTLQTYVTPGAGITYRMVGDPSTRREPPAPPQPQVRAPQSSAPQAGGADRTLGTGANGLEWRDDKLWMAVPPAREIFCLDSTSWIVERKFNTAGNRAHGLGWEGRWLWNGDPNLNGFFKHDPTTGEIVEKIQLGERDALPHGMTIWKSAMWYCDEVGVVCRLQLT